MIEPDVLERLHSITARTGLSQSEQIRQGIRWWLESREWPLKGQRSEPPVQVEEEPRRTPVRAGRRARRRPLHR